MIEGFEIIDFEKEKEWKSYAYTFKINAKVFYSDFGVYRNKPEIVLNHAYYTDVKYESKGNRFSQELLNEIKAIILKRPNIRLRHIVNPYEFV